MMSGVVCSRGVSSVRYKPRTPSPPRAAQVSGVFRVDGARNFAESGKFLVIKKIINNFAEMILSNDI